MFRKLAAIVLCLNMFVMLPLAQAAPRTDKSAQSSTSGARHHLATIVFAGLAGAILGLSTLSFYGRPQDRLSNIAVGFAIGVISGTIYTTYKAAAEPKDFYGLRDPSEAQLYAFEQNARRDFVPPAPRTGFTFQF